MKAARCMKSPEEKLNKLGSMNDLSGPIEYRATMFIIVVGRSHGGKELEDGWNEHAGYQGNTQPRHKIAIYRDN